MYTARCEQSVEERKTAGEREAWANSSGQRRRRCSWRGQSNRKWERSSRWAEQWGHCKAQACVASSCKRASGVVVWLEVQVRQNHSARSGGRGEGVVGTEVTGSGRTSAMGHRASSGHKKIKLSPREAGLWHAQQGSLLRLVLSARRAYRAVCCASQFAPVRSLASTQRWRWLRPGCWR